MSRAPELAPDEYDEIVKFIDSIGYDTSKIERVPQSWPPKKKEPLKRDQL
jgi:apolipoprotein D and lipocalin family protein